METLTPDHSEMDRFAAALGGRLIQPSDRDYDEARAVWNGMADRRPAMIARCESAADVVRAVDFARHQDLRIAVRAGGHSVAGKSTLDGGLVIDLSPMDRVQVDPVARTARVGGGAIGRQLDEAAQAHGLAVTAGTDSSTGVAGLTLGGGVGFLARSCGLAADNLIGADVVLADGTQVHAGESEHSDLLWALRGGGGNFGVVTALEFRLHEVGPEVHVAQIFHPYENVRDVLRFYRNFSSEAQDEVGCYALVVNVPPVAPFPEEYQGKPAVVLAACYAGPVDEGKAQLAPLEAFGEPFFSAVQPMPYAALQQSFDGSFPAGKRYYWKSHYMSRLPDDAIDVFARHAGNLPGAYSSVFFEPMGGAVNRVDTSATAFPHRNAAFNLGICGGWEDPSDDERAVAWARTFYEEMIAWSTGGVYVNYLDRDDEERVRSAFGENWGRLRRVKASYDPDNFFDSNQNVGPTP